MSVLLNLVGRPQYVPTRLVAFAATVWQATSAPRLQSPAKVDFLCLVFMNSILINQLLTLFKLSVRIYILNTFSLCKLRLKHLKKTFKLLRNYLLPT